MKKILTVLGARPQFIKASVVSHCINLKDGLSEILVHTGQHYDANMSDIFFTELGMKKPDYSLGISGVSHGAMTGRMLESIEEIMMKEKPDIVLVYGDTNSTLAGALAAAKLKIPIAHIEAGLRSFNMTMPEEINRILTDRISNRLYTPTQISTKNLLNEGHSANNIIQVGDVMLDVAVHHGSRVLPNSGLMAKLNLIEKGYILATIHRAENTDNPKRLESIVSALKNISKNIPVIWPLHPRTRNMLKSMGKLESLMHSVKLIEPVGYLDMVQLEKFAALIATDSGGVQKEAFFYKVPCVTLRNETEWVELVNSGWNHLASPDDNDLLTKKINEAIGTSGQEINPYGAGDAANKIVSDLFIYMDSIVK